MLFLRTKLLPLVIVLGLLPMIAESENVDSILRHANLPKLIGTNEAVNLAAQPLDPKGSSNNVNTFNNFVALGVVSSPSVQTNMTSFNKKQIILQKTSMAGPWIGVARYTQNEIPNVLLQTGFMDVQACMSKKGTPTPSKEVTNVVIYKALKDAQFVYDYSFKIPNKTFCQEVLYIPATKSCTFGMQKSCHIIINKSMFKANKIKST